MKKYIAILCILATVFCFAACGKEYHVYVVGNNDLSNNLHASEYEFPSIEMEPIDTKEKTQSYTFQGVIYELTYKTSIEYRMYQSAMDWYEWNNDSVAIDIGINPYTGKIDYFNWTDQNYLSTDIGTEKTEDECLEIGKAYLAQQIDDFSDYELVDVQYDDISTFKGVHTFVFDRVIDGVQTVDFAMVDVTVYGTVVSHKFSNLGSMKGAKLPSKSEMEDIRESVSEKMEKIYDGYIVEYGEEELKFMRLKDGRYALSFTYENILYEDEDKNKGDYDIIELVVFVE